MRRLPKSANFISALDHQNNCHEDVLFSYGLSLLIKLIIKFRLPDHDFLNRLKHYWLTILYPQDDRDALMAETQAQSSQLGAFKNCRIKTRTGGRSNRTVIVDVFPGKSTDPGDDEATHFDYDKKIGQRYWLMAPKTFPTDESTLKCMFVK